MALINCPECSKQISDQSEICVNCGFPIGEHIKDADPLTFKPHTVCPMCNSLNAIGIHSCVKCGYKYKLKDYDVIEPTNGETFNGVYRYVFGEKIRVYCQKCKSSNCSHYKQEIAGKSNYGLNFNPFRPFTFFNKKQVGKNKIINKFMCNDCGYIFD